MYKELENKVAVVTGGSKGIGTAIAQRFGKEKMNVVVNYNSDKEGAEKAVKAIEEAGGKAVSVQADVSSEEGIQRLLDTALENFGTLDIWVNNAGMENQHPTHELSLEDWERVLKVNLTGVFIGTKAALNYFTENDKKGNIINISSASALRPLTRVAGYGAAKAAVTNFTKYMAGEMAIKFGESFRVNAICPGFFITEQNRNLLTNPDGTYTERGNDVIRQTPFRRFGKPEELCGTAQYLISDASSFVTGTVAVVDGGFNTFAM